MKLHNRLGKILENSRFTDFNIIDFETKYSELAVLDRDAARNIGILVDPSNPMPTIVSTDASKSIGTMHIQTRSSNNLIFVDNAESEGQLFASINIHGEGTQCLFNDAGKHFVSIGILNLRSHRQSFFIGKDSSAVGLSVELEGEDKICVIGDDALISSGVWFRNHDMHTIVDLADNSILNPTPGDILMEKHVWLGQDVLCIGGQHIGFGAIVGARSFVKRPIPEKSVAVGTPAKVVKTNVSWGRQNGMVSEKEFELLAALSSTPASH